MKHVRAVLVGFAVAVAMVAGAASMLAATAQPARAVEVSADDPGCVGKVLREICPLPDGAGGVCAEAVCPGRRRCLHCIPQRLENADGSPWVPMISFGVLVALVGFVFWFRMKRNWGKS
ncbi:MAG: hypothetical protein U1F43_22850 [Myxococcota bacterium]